MVIGFVFIKVNINRKSFNTGAGMIALGVMFSFLGIVSLLAG